MYRIAYNLQQVQYTTFFYVSSFDFECSRSDKNSSKLATAADRIFENSQVLHRSGSLTLQTQSCIY